LKAVQAETNFQDSWAGGPSDEDAAPFPVSPDANRTALSTVIPTAAPKEGKVSVHADVTERLDEIRTKVQELRGYL